MKRSLTALLIAFALMIAGCSENNTEEPDMKAHIHEKGGFKIEYPKDWEVQTRRDGEIYSLFSSIDGKAQFKVNALPIAQGAGLDQFVALQKRYLGEKWPGIRFIAQENTVFGGMNGKVLSAEFQKDGEQDLTKGEIYLGVADSTAYRIFCFGPKANSGQNTPVFKKMLDSFSITGIPRFKDASKTTGGQATG